MLHMVFICCPFCVPSTVSLSSWGLLPLFPFCLTSSLLILSLHVTPSVRCAPPIVSYSRLLFSKFQLHVAVLVKTVSCLTIICFSAQSFVLLNILESSRHRICLSSSCSSHSCPCQWQSFPSRRNVLPSQYFFLLPILLCHCELDIFHWFFLHSFRTVCFHLYVICDLPSVLWHCWLGGRKGIRPVKNWVVGCWCGYLSGARCRLAYGPADATTTHCLLLQ